MEVALAGFLSSVCATKVITKSLLPINVEDQINRFWDSACNLWKEKSAQNSTPEQPIYQSSWDKELYDFRYQELLHTSTDKEEKARVLAVSSPKGRHGLSCNSQAGRKSRHDNNISRYLSYNVP